MSRTQGDDLRGRWFQDLYIKDDLLVVATYTSTANSVLYYKLQC